LARKEAFLTQEIKIRIPLPEGSFAGETLWAEKVGEDLYRLLNIPFSATGYAEADIVRCQKREGWDEVIALEKDSGNGTLRLMFADSTSKEAQFILDELVSVRCIYERASSKLVAVTVPSSLEVPFSQLSNFLNNTSDDVLIGWEVAKSLTQVALDE
jgi:hypothetical protein